MIHPIKRGLNIPITGAPVQKIEPGPLCTTVALLGDDYWGMRPTMLVKAGERVQLGQPVFTDKKNEGVTFTSPAGGTVVDIVRGEKRAFKALIVEIDAKSGEDPVIFHKSSAIGELSGDEIRNQLLQSGLWTALRTRPYSKIPGPASSPHSIFVTAMDTRPLAAEPELIIDRHREHFVHGLHALKQLTEGPVFVCTRTDSRVPGTGITGVQIEQFSGPHPAGLPGTHIHLLDPVGLSKTVWFINYQDVIAVGHLFSTGLLMTERVISVAGPAARRPGVFVTRLGANLTELTRNQLPDEETRIVSGSILCGRTAAPPDDFLGRYHIQVSLLREGREREFLGWQRPGANKFSVTKAYWGSWLKNKLFPMTTTQNGSPRAMVPIGVYERVMPLDILPTQLLRALITTDTDQAQALGALELDEEDLGLCTFVCPGKYEYGRILRDNLNRIEKEG